MKNAHKELGQPKKIKQGIFVLFSTEPIISREKIFVSRKTKKICRKYVQLIK